jgi:hypothetical protein
MESKYKCKICKNVKRVGEEEGGEEVWKKLQTMCDSVTSGKNIVGLFNTLCGYYAHRTVW